MRLDNFFLNLFPSYYYRSESYSDIGLHIFCQADFDIRRKACFRVRVLNARNVGELTLPKRPTKGVIHGTKDVFHTRTKGASLTNVDQRILLKEAVDARLIWK